MSVNKLRAYILEDEFKLVITHNKINIVNYLDIDHFDTNKITVHSKDKTVVISGSNLFISKLLKDELLIEGKIKGIEFND